MLRRVGGAAVGILAVGYATLSGFAARPLGPSEFGVFAAAVLRATPAHLSGSTPLETLRLGGRAFRSPVRAVTLEAGGEVHSIPLPPRTAEAAPRGPDRRFVTFATAEELTEYLHSTLPRAGWRYREQFGSMHALERGDLFLSVQSTFYVGTRVRELRIDLRSRGAT